VDPTRRTDAADSAVLVPAGALKWQDIEQKWQKE
jgi:hypothetical protein